MNLNNKQVLIVEQLSKVNAPIFINDVIGDNINSCNKVMNKYSVSLEKISKLLEDEKLIKIKNTEEWINLYNQQNGFLTIDVIDRIVEVNL